MAGFRMGRGRGSRTAQQQGQYRAPQAPGQAAPGAGPGAYGQRPPQQQWPHATGGHGEPEYLGDPRGGQPSFGPGPRAGYGQRQGQGGQGPYPQGPGYGQGAPGGRPGPAQGHGGPAADPFADAPGHTQSFSVSDPYGQDDGYVRPSGPPPGPRLRWQDLLRGIVLRPNATFWQMRDHAVWAPALIITFLYGMLAIFGLEQGREEVLQATLSSAIPYVLSTGIAVVLAGLILGSVTHTLARQFGGDGAWAPTVGLAMLIMSLTDVPRLLVALFMGGTAPAVQVLGWVTWIAAGALFTSMVSRSHDLHWPRALGASAVQLLALLVLLKLGSL